MNTLNQEVPSNQPNFNQNPPNYNQSPTSYDQQVSGGPPNYTNSRRKRSVTPMDNDNSYLYDQIASKVKEYIFSQHIEENNPYKAVQARINNIQSELGEPRLCEFLFLQ